MLDYPLTVGAVQVEESVDLEVKAAASVSDRHVGSSSVEGSMGVSTGVEGRPRYSKQVWLAVISISRE